MDGGTTIGPLSSLGVIASVLDHDPKDLPVANFLSVSGKVVDTVRKANNKQRFQKTYTQRLIYLPLK